MSLSFATLLVGLFLLVLGGLFFWNGKPVERGAKGLLRSQVATLVFFGTASVWFLWHIAHLGEADFGNYKHWLLALFAVVAVGSFYVVNDFLAVRGIAALMLLSARPLLDAAFMEAPTSRLLMVSAVYIGIVIALYVGTVPFKLRDFFNWLFSDRSRPKILGSVMAVYGLVLTGVAFTY